MGSLDCIQMNNFPYHCSGQAGMNCGWHHVLVGLCSCSIRVQHCDEWISWSDLLGHSVVPMNIVDIFQACSCIVPIFTLQYVFFFPSGRGESVIGFGFDFFGVGFCLFSPVSIFLSDLCSVELKQCSDRSCSKLSSCQILPFEKSWYMRIWLTYLEFLSFLPFCFISR